MESHQISESYPIGKYIENDSFTPDSLTKMIDEIAALPGDLRKAVSNLTNNQLDTPYREGGWTLRQVVHHIADSHMNAYIRFKLTYTEENVVIRPYFQSLWAETEDGKNMDIEVSLVLIEALHSRWVIFLRSFQMDDFNKSYIHPEYGTTVKLHNALGNYAWHGKHHLTHITNKIKKEGWN